MAMLASVEAASPILRQLLTTFQVQSTLNTQGKAPDCVYDIYSKLKFGKMGTFCVFLNLDLLISQVGYNQRARSVLCWDDDRPRERYRCFEKDKQMHVSNTSRKASKNTRLARRQTRAIWTKRDERNYQLNSR